MGRFEERVWRPSRRVHAGRRHRAPQRIRTYVPNPLTEWEATIPGAAAAIISEADRAVSELNRDAAAFTGLEALSRQLLRQESVASSRIEGLAMGQRRLARAAHEAGGDDAARQIVGNIRAMERAIELGSQPRAFTYNDLIEIHATLLEATRDRHLAGVVREEQNWVGGRGFSPADAEFIPPPPEFVDELLRDLVAFTNREDLPATLQAAAAHAQFETIHPFVDGNGRVGRCLIHVVLRRAGIAPNVVPPISLILATGADDYIRGLDAWRGDEPVEWCLYYAGVAITAVREARRLATMVEQLQAEWLGLAGNPRRGSSARALIDQLPGEPIVSVARAMELTATTRPAADRAIRALEKAEVLASLGDRRRNRRWEAREIFDLLDRFERELAIPTERTRPARPAPRARH
jgi:Fic family protein